MIDLLDFLQSWYSSKCDDSWEHSYGVEISSIDNPGWRVKITGAAARKQVKINCERNESDWLIVNASDNEFLGYGGAGNLRELLGVAVDWLK